MGVPLSTKSLILILREASRHGGDLAKIDLAAAKRPPHLAVAAAHQNDPAVAADLPAKVTSLPPDFPSLL
jgi:hypothetical protein